MSFRLVALVFWSAAQKQTQMLHVISLINNKSCSEMETQTLSDPYTTEFYLRTTCCLSLLIPIIVFPTVGQRNRKSSNYYSLQVTPPSRFFIIWAFIETFFDAAAIYCAYYDLWSPQAWMYFAAVNVTCGLWTVVFVQTSILTNNICLLILIGLVYSGQLLLNQLSVNPQLNDLAGTIVRNIFAFGQGWFVAAVNLNIGMVLVYTLGLSHKLQTAIFWVLVPLSYAASLHHNTQEFTSFEGSMGQIVTMVYAMTGALISTFSPMKPREKLA